MLRLVHLLLVFFVARGLLPFSGLVDNDDNQNNEQDAPNRHCDSYQDVLVKTFGVVADVSQVAMFTPGKMINI